MLKVHRVEEGTRRQVSFPLLFLLFAIFGYSTTLSFACIWDKSKFCIPDIAQILIQRSYFFQSSLLLASYFGIMTIVTFSPISSHRFPQKSTSLRLGKWVVQVSGLASMTVLILLSLVPSESKELHRTELLTEESTLIWLYFCLVAIHAYSTTYMRELIHQHEVVTQPSLWRSFRIWLTRFLVLTTIIYLISICKKPISHSTITKYLGHLLFICSFLYILTYHEDLSSIEVSLHSQDRFRPTSLSTL